MRDSYVHPALGDAFAQVVNHARALTGDEADDLQEVYEDHWSNQVDRAGGRVHRALERAGLSRNYDDRADRAWRYLDELCGIVGGASDVAGAVLARDHRLINERDFGTLTAWWLAADLPLPAPGPDAGFAPNNAADALTRRPWFRALTAAALVFGLVAAAVIAGLAALDVPVDRASLTVAAVVAVISVAGLTAWRRGRSRGAR